MKKQYVQAALVAAAAAKVATELCRDNEESKADEKSVLTATIMKSRPHQAFVKYFFIP